MTRTIRRSGLLTRRRFGVVGLSLLAALAVEACIPSTPRPDPTPPPPPEPTQPPRRLRGLAYTSVPDPQVPQAVRPQEVELRNLRLTPGQSVRLRGGLVEVVNYGVLVSKDAATGRLRGVPMGEASTSDGGGFTFRPRSGGPLPWDNEKAGGAHNGWALEAARFGEVNAYYHADRAITFANGLLAELGERPLPYLRVVVNAHACSRLPGYRQNDGDDRDDTSRPFHGGHYRLPTVVFEDNGFAHVAQEINPTGEIHLGPGGEHILSADGDPVVVDGRPYTRTASHNPGIVVHEVGHHINSHTADFRANRDRRPNEYSNRTIHLDEGTADYWAAVILRTPDIFNWQHADEELDDSGNRDLRGPRTTDEFSSGGDPHRNGNIWSSALWDLRRAMGGTGHQADVLVMKTLTLLGTVPPDNRKKDEEIRRDRIEQKDEFRDGLAMLLKADEALSKGRDRSLILQVMEKRGIEPKKPDDDF
jgi:hypothetical protein